MLSNSESHHFSEPMLIKSVMKTQFPRHSGFWWLAVPIFMFLISLGFTVAASAQDGRIEGFVYDSHTEKPIQYAKVVIPGSEFRTLTDGNGRYVLYGLPNGRHTLSIAMVGYETSETKIELPGAEVVRQDIQLVFARVEGDQVNVINNKKQWAGVYAGLSGSVLPGQSLTATEMLQTGDYNLGRALARMPGVQVSRFGELNLRGAGRGRYGVQIDGMPVAATDITGRRTDLGLISTDLIQYTQIVGGPTPDMDASGIGGVFRLNTWQPVGTRDIQVSAGGMAMSDYNILSGLGRVASINYSERFTDQFSMSAAVSHQQEVNGYESLGIWYGAAEFGDGFVDVIERVSPGLHGETRTRSSGRFQFAYQPDMYTNYFLTGMFVADAYDTERHANTSRANGDWIDQTTTGNIGLRGLFQYNPSLIESRVQYNVVQAGGEHLVNKSVIRYSLGWSGSNLETNNFDFLFGRDRLNYSVDMSDRFRPVMTITNVPLMSDGSVDQRTMLFNRVDRTRNQQFDNRYSSRVELEAPVGILQFKLGSSLLYTLSERRFEDATLSSLRQYHQFRFQKMPRSNVDVFDRYYFPDLADTRLAGKYVDVSRPDMRLNEDNMLRRSLPYNYEMDEVIIAGFVMSRARFGALDLSGGIRAEMTRAEYTGRKVLFNQFSFFDSSTDSTTSIDYLDLFPYAAVAFALTDRSNVKLAYSRSVDRPAHEMLAPFELIFPVDTLRSMGNSDLKPMFSDNIDVVVEHVFDNVGAVSLGMYYKRLTNFVYMRQQKVPADGFPFLQPPANGLMVNEQTHVNSEKTVDLYGAIISWYQHMEFLPGPFGDLRIHANYSWSYSDTRDNRQPGDSYLRHLSPHVVNASLQYARNRYMAQIVWHWSAPSLFGRSTELQLAPEISNSDMTYVDRYEDGWSDLSAHVGFRISENFRFWANVYNLLPTEHRLYGDSPESYIYDVTRMSGIKVSTGIRFNW